MQSPNKDIIMTVKIDPTDIHYEYTNRGYMLYYKNKPIGGAGINKRSKSTKSNTSLFKSLAESTKQSILHGRIDKYMLDAILEIDAKNN